MTTNDNTLPTAADLASLDDPAVPATAPKPADDLSSGTPAKPLDNHVSDEDIVSLDNHVSGPPRP